ncbi:hypothetical protein [Georgenia sp. AZ-5]|uniref:ATP-dependent DNA ligase n=1 Tax=Georgenia sp. AZ-5 TaxID=3367526 RepID=UPI0037549937
MVVCDGEHTTLWSRQRKDLTRHFPDLAAAAAAQVPSGCILDGEAVAWTNRRLDFGALQTRLTTSPRALARVIRRHPGLLRGLRHPRRRGTDTRTLPLHDRRALLKNSPPPGPHR